jgi:hypothetical protein
MLGNVAALQAMALKYLELARVATDPMECEKLRQYAALYRDMAAQASAVPKAAMKPAAIPADIITIAREESPRS